MGKKDKGREVNFQEIEEGSVWGFKGKRTSGMLSFKEKEEEGRNWEF